MTAIASRDLSAKTGLLFAVKSAIEDASRLVLSRAAR
jgi:hypothetical protein